MQNVKTKTVKEVSRAAKGSKERHSVVIAFRIDASLTKKLKRQAASFGMSIGEVVRLMVEHCLTHHTSHASLEE